MNSMKILFAGGGSLGPVTPLLAVAEVLRFTDPSTQFVWAGTPNGPERSLVEAEGIPFFSVSVARIPRYPTWEWIAFPWNILYAWSTAFSILRRERPNIIGCAGGFTGVPFVILGKWMGIPSWLHQPDVKPVMTNRACAPFAKLITVAWPETVTSFPVQKTVVLGQPVRASMLSGNAQRIKKQFGFDQAKPTLLILGGGGGSVWINQAFEAEIDRVRAVANVIHLVGRGKLTAALQNAGAGYAAVELLGRDLADALAAAEVVVTRAGMGALAELAALEKPCVLVPLPNSPQTLNAKTVEAHEAALVVTQMQGTSTLVETVIDLLQDKQKQRLLSLRIGALLAPDAATQVAQRIQKLIL